MGHLLLALRAGATALVIPRPDPEVVLRAVARHHATWFGALRMFWERETPGAAE
jgi:hypothetical protein